MSSKMKVVTGPHVHLYLHKGVKMPIQKNKRSPVRKKCCRTPSTGIIQGQIIDKLDVLTY